MNPCATNFDDGRFPGIAISMLSVGILAGLLASAFALGGLWALRGRPALRVPMCQRCRSQLRGEGTAIPSVCPECAADLRPARAVQWLRFRRQAMTFLVTAPIVMIGGSVLALAAAVILWQGVGRVIGNVIGDAVDTYGSGEGMVTTSESDEQPAVEPISIIALAARARQGGEDGASALQELSLRVPRSDLSPDEVNAVRDLARDTLNGTAPMTPFPGPLLAPSWRDSPIHPPSRDTAFYLLGDLANADLIAVDDVRTLVEPLLRDVHCVAPAALPLGAHLCVALVDDPAGVATESTFTRVRLDGVEHFAIANNPFIDMPTDAVGAHVLEVEWRSHVRVPSTSTWKGTAAFLAETTSASRFTINAVDGPVEIPGTSDAYLSPLRGFWAVSISRVGERSLLRALAPRTMSTALIGDWTITIGARTEALGSTDERSSVIQLEFKKLIDLPQDSLPSEVTVHFAPRTEAAERASNRPRPEFGRWNPAPVAQWAAPIDVHLVVVERSEGTVVYRIPGARW